MAQRTVQLIIGQMLTDEEFRSDFLERPIETLRSLRERGLELTNVEIDALAQTDRRFWLIGAEWIDARLQRCRLVGGERKGHARTRVRRTVWRYDLRTFQCAVRMSRGRRRTWPSV